MSGTTMDMKVLRIELPGELAAVAIVAVNEWQEMVVIEPVRMIRSYNWLAVTV